MNLITTKILVAALFGIFRFFTGVLPINIYSCLKCLEKEEEGAKFISEKRHRQINCYIALFQSFSGGVLFATCFLHMMPAVYEFVIELRKYGDIVTKFPYSQLIICAGFFVVYFVEELSHWFVNSTNKCMKKRGKKRATTRAITPAGLPPPTINGYVDEEKTPRKLNEQILSEYVDGKKMPYVIDYGNNEKRPPSIVNGYFDESEEKEEADETDPEEGLDTLEDDQVQPVKELEMIINRQSKTRQQILRCILIMLALSFHAVFEGVAIGLQKSIPDIWYLFTAVSVHSATILFCTSFELLIAKAKIKTILTHVLLLSVTSPLGVLTGLAITMTTDMNTHAKSVAVVFLEGFSTGTILYITFFEVLKREKERRIYSFRRGIFILAGFTLMAVLEYAEVYH